MRLRQDNHWEAGFKRAVALGAVPDPRSNEKSRLDPEYVRTHLDGGAEAAQDGDVWEVLWRPDRPGTISWTREKHEDWTLIGYGLWCPNERCIHGVHFWDHASDCDFIQTGICKSPKPEGQVQSCWVWAGSISDGTLTASPSLFVDDASCGWHGYLKSGVMEGSIDQKFRAA